MTKKKTDISEYCTAAEAAQILTQKLGRVIKPGYVHRVKGVGCLPLTKTTKLYLRADIEKAEVRKRAAS